MYTAMGAAKPLVKEITHYLGQLNTEQQKAVLGVVKTFAQEEPWWNDKSYMNEMDRRFAELEAVRRTVLPWMNWKPGPDKHIKAGNVKNNELHLCASSSYLSGL